MAKSNRYTQATLRWIKRQGWAYAITERWNPFAKVRQDLFGFIDILVLTGESIIGIQSTDFANRLARARKIRDEKYEIAKLWIQSGGEILVVSWQLPKEKGGVKRPRKQGKQEPHIINLAPILGELTTLLLGDSLEAQKLSEDVSK